VYALHFFLPQRVGSKITFFIFEGRQVIVSTDDVRRTDTTIRGGRGFAGPPPSSRQKRKMFSTNLIKCGPVTAHARRALVNEVLTRAQSDLHNRSHSPSKAQQ
jgi:hypothetical protein